jgi:hypothetical protein
MLAEEELRNCGAFLLGESPICSKWIDVVGYSPITEIAKPAEPEEEV